jgi:hypothetical protein
MDETRSLKAPFPYFGGKRRVAELVWRHLGNPDNYIEPFFGSGAVLLCRPDPPKIETVNDLDSMVANFWRATQHDPEAVAAHADGPVNEADLHSRHRWLVLSDDAATFRERMRTDPDYYDAKVAGWWCWGLCCWIGSGWCSIGVEWEQTPAGQRPLTGVHGQSDALTQKLPRAPRESGSGSTTTMPGVHAHLSHIRDGNRPQLADAYDIGRGVHASPPTQKRPTLGGDDNLKLGQGVNAWGPTHPDLFTATNGICETRRAWLLDWFGRLRDRLRNVRVCCGDWTRVCSSESVTTRLGLTGVFLDPPYAHRSGRSKNLYAQESATVADDVRHWCLERGDNPLLRICLAGYEGEHEELEAHGWCVVAWEAQGGYGNRSAKGKANAKRERLWFSPHCIFERLLFDEAPP